MRIKRIGVLSLARIQAVIMGTMGLLLGIFYALLGVSNIGLGMSFGALMIVVMPILYALIGFVFGAWIYNVAAKYVGGVEIEFDKHHE